MVRFEPVKRPEEIEQVSNLATIIWHEAYEDILTKTQRNYMLTKFQSCEAIQNQIEEGMEYFLLFYHGCLAGYLGLGVEEECLLISKIYILKKMRGKGILSEILNFANEKSRKENNQKLRLYVNKYNKALKAYEARGFKVVKSVVKDIGSGYIMDDYCMELEVL